MTGCNRHEEYINRLTDGDLDDPAAAELFAHLGQCSTCRSTLRTLSTLKERIHDIPSPAAPASLDRRIAAIPSADRSSQRRPVPAFVKAFRRTVAVPIPAAAVVLLTLLTVGFLLWQLGRTASRPAPSGETTVMVLYPTIEVYAHSRPSHPETHE
jgi:anti-sigma factor RsiW